MLRFALLLCLSLSVYSSDSETKPGKGNKPVVNPPTTTGVIYEDVFAEKNFSGRRMARGEWRVEDGKAICNAGGSSDEKDVTGKSDPKGKGNDKGKKKGGAEEKNNEPKDHGPVLWHMVDFDDATITWDFKPTGYTGFNIVMNSGGGHCFRILWRAGEKGRALAWGDNHKSKGMSSDVPEIINGQWNTLAVTFKGETVSIVVNGSEPIVVKDATYKKTKTISGMTFNDGLFEFRKFSVTK